MFYKDERLALFIDGGNLFNTSRALGFDIDFKLLLSEFQRRGKLVHAMYYTAIVENEEYSPLRPLVDWLNYNGYSTVTKTAREFTDAMGNRRFRGGMEVELTVDAMEMAPRIDHAIVFSGNGDYRSLVASLQRQGVRVSVVSSVKTQPSMVSDDLRRQADNFIELDALRAVISRPARQEREDDSEGNA